MDLQKFWWIKYLGVTTRWQYQLKVNLRIPPSPCFHVTTSQMKKSKELLTCCFISHNSTASMLPVAHCNPTLLVRSLSAPPVTGCVGWGPLHLQGLVWSKCCLMSHWPIPSLSINLRPPFFAWNPPKAFYPFIQTWDQNSRSEFGSVSGSVVSNIFWSISLHLFFTSLALPVHRKMLSFCFILCSRFLLSWRWAAHQR